WLYWVLPLDARGLLSGYQLLRDSAPLFSGERPDLNYTDAGLQPNTRSCTHTHTHTLIHTHTHTHTYTHTHTNTQTHKWLLLHRLFTLLIGLRMKDSVY